MRGWVSAVRNYSEPVAIGAVMRSFAAGRVQASRRPRRAGRHVRDRPVRLAGLRGGRASRDPAHRQRSRPAAVDGARRHRAERRHRALRAAADRTAARRRDGGRVDRRGAVGSASARSRSSRDAARSALRVAQGKRTLCTERSATTRRSTTRRTTSATVSQSMRERRRRLLRQHRRCDQRRGDDAPESAARASSSAALRRSRAGTRRRKVRVSSAICSSSARACRAS